MAMTVRYDLSKYWFWYIRELPLQVVRAGIPCIQSVPFVENIGKVTRKYEHICCSNTALVRSVRIRWGRVSR